MMRLVRSFPTASVSFRVRPADVAGDGGNGGLRAPVTNISPRLIFLRGLLSWLHLSPIQAAIEYRRLAAELRGHGSRRRTRISSAGYGKRKGERWRDKQLTDRDTWPSSNIRCVGMQQVRSPVNPLAAIGLALGAVLG